MIQELWIICSNYKKNKACLCGTPKMLKQLKTKY